MHFTTTYNGDGNAAFGLYALYSNTTGLINAAIGTSALKDNTTGSYNSAIGYQAISKHYRWCECGSWFASTL